MKLEVELEHFKIVPGQDFKGKSFSITYITSVQPCYKKSREASHIGLFIRDEHNLFNEAALRVTANAYKKIWVAYGKPAEGLIGKPIIAVYSRQDLTGVMPLQHSLRSVLLDESS